MKASTYISSFYIAKLAQAVSSSYTSLEAYRAGSIDENGNIVKPESSIDPFEYLVIKLKKIFDQLPYGTTKAQLSNYMATLNLFTEQASPELQMFLEGVVTSLEINEDTVVGGGGPGTMGTPASPSVSTGGVAGFDPVMAVGLKRKKPIKYFNNCEVFEVCPEELISFKSAKQWKEVPDSETKTYLQRFQRRNKAAKIGVVGKNPISGDQDLYWITYPSKNFMGEEYSNIKNFITESLNKISPQDVHKKFKEHLISQGYSEQKFPDIKVRKNSEELKKYHESLPAKSFYVSNNTDAPYGSDAFVKIESGEHSGIELKKSYPSKEREKKPPHHGMSGISVKSPLLDYAARIYGKMKELSSRPKSLKKAFAGAGPQNGEPYSERYIGKVVEQGSQKAIEQKGDLIIGGHPEGVHVLSSSRKKNNQLFDKHAKIASAIGFNLTGNIRDWGGTLQTGYKASRPTKKADPGVALKTRVEVSPVPEDHEMYGHYVNNAKFLN